MKKLLSLLSIVVLVFSTDLSVTGTGSPQHEEATELKQFAKEIQDTAKRFSERLVKTREFNPKADDLFLASFVDCHLRAELKGQENGIFRQIGASISPGVASAASNDELQQYLIAQLNFFHLKTLYRMSTRDLEGKSDGPVPSAEEDYPPGVYKLLLKNPVIAAQNVQELRSVLQTLNEASSALRAHFKKNPPEKTKLYKKNMERIGNDKNNSKFWEASFLKFTEQQTKESKDCFGFSANSFAIVKVPPFYQLFVFQTGKQFKIGSLMCTEPPCVD